jgi:hypothetical protein
MNTRPLPFVIAALLAGAIACAAETKVDATPRNKREAEAEWSADGLQKTKVKGLDLVYARPGASLEGYKQVLLPPISVTFRKEHHNPPGSPYRMSAADAERIRGRLAALVREELRKELGKGGYQLVDAAGDDVLEMQMSIIDLHAAAPDLATPGRVDVFAFSAGEMTLVAELRDSVSGETIMRIYDRAQAMETSQLQRITVVQNVQEAGILAGHWARAIRRELDLARGVPAKR